MAIASAAKYIHDLIGFGRWKRFLYNIISKSGTTTEPAIAFRVFKEMLIEKYGKEEANKRIYATTDRARGCTPRIWQMKRATSPSWFRMMLAVVSPS